MISLENDETYGKFLEVDFVPFIVTSRFVSFEAEFPQGNPGGMWFVNFEPSTIVYDIGNIMKAKATISLNAPPSSDTPIQSGIIRIKVTDTWVYGNLWTNQQPDATILEKIFWFWGATPLGAGYGKYSATIEPQIFYVDVLVKVKPYHAVKIDALPPEKLQPNQVVSIPVIVENLGNYNDTFSFKIASEHENIKLVDPGSISLRPGEVGYSEVGVAVSPSVLDTGTLHSLKLEVYSTDQPNVTIANQRVFLETQGIYLSEINITYAVIFGLLILLGIIFFFHRRKRVLARTLKKPDKPWTIPEEKKYLEELKKKDRDEFEKVRLMMEDEYKSAMLWYDDYRKEIKKKPKSKKNNNQVLENFFKKSKSRKLKQPPKEKIIKEKEIPEKTKKETIDLKAIEDQRNKEKLLLKIRRAQEKQKSKIKS